MKVYYEEKWVNERSQWQSEEHGICKVVKVTSHGFILKDSKGNFYLASCHDIKAVPSLWQRIINKLKKHNK